MLTFLALAPILTGLFLLAVRPVFGARTIALVIAALEALLVIGIGFQFDRSSSAVQFEQVVSLAPVLGLQHYVGIDGIGFLFVFLSRSYFLNVEVLDVENGRICTSIFHRVPRSCIDRIVVEIDIQFKVQMSGTNFVQIGIRMRITGVSRTLF